jgi:hypothetical protein
MSQSDNAGLYNDKPSIRYVADSAIADAGYLLKRGSAAGHVDLCAAGNMPIGYALMSTVAPTSGIAEASKEVPVQKLAEGDIVYLQLSAATGAVTLGDLLAPTADGKVAPKTATSMYAATWVVATAEEAVDASTGGVIKARVRLFYAAAGQVA